MGRIGIAALSAALALTLGAGAALAQPAPLGAGAQLEDERNTIEVFRFAAPSTVFITQKRLVRDPWSVKGGRELEAGSGSGFIWDRQGHIVTNYHVIAEGSSFEVTLQNGRTLNAKLVGGDPAKDIAVLQVAANPAELTPIRLPPERAALTVGQKTLAIGNPFGLDHTLTTGIISALGREMVGYGGVTIRGIIQTDASINPGNSGGPLLNSAGELIGMNTMIYSRTGSSVGIGFAVPVDIIRRVVPELIKFGRPIRAGLGIQIVPDEIAHRNGIKGVVIESVAPGSPAAQAGLNGLRVSRRGTLLGDVIVGIEEHKVESYDDLYSALDRYRPGDTVKVKLLRDGKGAAVELTLTSVGGR